MIETMLMAVILLLAVILLITAYILLELMKKGETEKQKKERPAHKAAASVSLTDDERRILTMMEKYDGGVSDGAV